MNEPGVQKNDRWARPYSKSIEYMNYKTAIMNMINQIALPAQFLGFYPVIQNIMKERRENIQKRLETLARSKSCTYYVRVYNMTTKVNYQALWEKMAPLLLKVCEN